MDLLVGPSSPLTKPARSQKEGGVKTALTLDDEMALFGDRSAQEVLDRYATTGPRDGALKCGAEGAIALRDRQHRPAETVAVVDTTAAGDSFDAGFLAQMDRGGSVADSLAAATHLAARVVATRGAILPKD